MRDIAASRFIERHYKPQDWLCVLLKHHTRKTKRFLKGIVQQHFMYADDLAAAKRQEWLKLSNDDGFSIYVTGNALKQCVNTRTEEDVYKIRNIYLDIDHGGNSMERINADIKIKKLPPYTTIVETSPGKFQLFWAADDFTAEEAKKLQQAMAIHYGADRSATDVARVLRLPGFINTKPEYKHLSNLVIAKTIQWKHLVSLEDFKIDLDPKVYADEKKQHALGGKTTKPSDLSNSGQDWKWVCKELETHYGDPEGIKEELITKLKIRRPDKHVLYARITVENAALYIESKYNPTGIINKTISQQSSNERKDMKTRKIEVHAGSPIFNNNPELQQKFGAELIKKPEARFPSWHVMENQISAFRKLQDERSIGKMPDSMKPILTKDKFAYDITQNRFIGPSDELVKEWLEKREKLVVKDKDSYHLRDKLGKRPFEGSFERRSNEWVFPTERQANLARVELSKLKENLKSFTSEKESKIRVPLVEKRPNEIKELTNGFKAFAGPENKAERERLGVTWNNKNKQWEVNVTGLNDADAKQKIFEAQGFMDKRGAGGTDGPKTKTIGQEANVAKGVEKAARSVERASGGMG